MDTVPLAVECHADDNEDLGKVLRFIEDNKGCITSFVICDASIDVNTQKLIKTIGYNVIITKTSRSHKSLNP
jgi:hypothetical protein